MNIKIDKISLNGQIYEAEQAEISALDQGFMNGVGALETFRVSGGKVFLLHEHFDRLAASLKLLNISWPDERSQYFMWIENIVKDIPSGHDGRLRFMVTAKAEKASDGNFLANTTIYLALIDKFAPRAKPAKILNSVHRQLPEYLSLSGVRLKTPDYLSAALAQKELDGKGGEGILLTPNGYVAEALTSNIFWANDGQLYTPPLSLGILPGIIRSDLILKQKAREKLITAKELEAAEEIFLTNGVNYLRPLSKINQIPKPGIAGTLFKKLYKNLESDIENLSIDIHSLASAV
ncbi:aminotransferase class IV [Candidatus Parcubacteria bacterium]|nr:aminotransferase class IV [Candidatus Parcubacteria bacterium]